jgi:DNA adenine methylase
MRAKTCLRFPGGKFYALKRIRPFLQIPHEEFREVLVGGASVFLDKELAPKLNWINDIDKELINFYKIIQNEKNRGKLFELLDNEIANKERHAEVKLMIPKNKIESAFKFFYLNRTSFSGIMNKPRWGYMIGSSVTPDKWIKIIKPVADKLKSVKITNWDFRKVISFKTKNKSVLMYADPPYFKASKSIYNHEFSKKDHEDLCELLKKTEFRFILSYEDCQEIRDLYEWANIHKIDFTYFMSEARRQTGRELIITNFKIGLKRFI